MPVREVDFILNHILDNYPKVSDINVSVGRPFQVEVDGELIPVELPVSIPTLTPFQTETFALQLLNNDRRNTHMLLEQGSADLSYAVGDRARFRINIFSARGNYSVVMRRLPTYIPTVEEMHLPSVLNETVEEKNGLVLVTGATGSGKSTTLAAVLRKLNQTKAVHVVTLEDPVEFVHKHEKATFNQRELGADFDAFESGLRAALRQAPKVILVGEMRDRATVEIALHAAETGHLVLSTLHTIDAGQTINRIVGMFEQAEEQLVRGRLAAMLRWIVGQRLLPKIGGGRLAALEIMRTNLRVQDSILHGESEGKTFYEIIDAGVASGMQTFDKSIIKGYRDGLITEQTALAYASQRSIVRRGIDEFNYAIGVAKDELGVKLAIDQEYDQRIYEERQKVGSR
ncbi:MAG TPA: PilT/PilU family type 4a pilus ATPase [Candidatus Saccharimonadia bacterium]|jgi:twitching motility protein PilT|nr:PilT/PilU family type 4a pilus ATPase [Candidatus Saccharimonadia bacterium]